MNDFDRAAVVSKERTRLNDQLNREAKHFREANVREVKRLIKDPLEDVEDEMRRHASQYWTTWGFKKDCRQIALKKIKRSGGLSSDLGDFVDEAIEDWLANEMKQYTDRLEFTTKAVMFTPLLVLGAAGFGHMQYQHDQQLSAAERFQRGPA